MSPLSQKDYPQDKQPGGLPPAYPNPVYYPQSQRLHTVVKKTQHSSRSNPDPPYNPGQYQPQPQPQVIYAERPNDKGNDAGLCATAWLVSVAYRCGTLTDDRFSAVLVSVQAVVAPAGAAAKVVYYSRGDVLHHLCTLARCIPFIVCSIQT